MKGQIWSVDLTVSSSILIIAAVAILLVWSFTSVQVAENKQTDAFIQQVLTISNTLVRTKGLPEDWTPSTVIALGLAQKEGVINSTKMIRMISLNYNRTKFLLGAKGDLFITVNHLNGSTIFLQGQSMSYGIPPINSFVTAPSERLVLFDGKPAIFSVILWH